jgi:hypothetical protein
VKPVQRAVISVIGALAVNWCVGWAYIFLFPSKDWHSQALIAQIVSKLCGLAAGILAWRLTASSDPRLVRYSITGACCTGFIGFLAGFIGPIIFTPHANQGPLLGILFTGPFGFVAGAVGGALYWLRRRSIPPTDEIEEKPLPVDSVYNAA